MGELWRPGTKRVMGLGKQKEGIVCSVTFAAAKLQQRGDMYAINLSMVVIFRFHSLSQTLLL